MLASVALPSAWLVGLTSGVLANLLVIGVRKAFELHRKREQLKIADERRFKEALDSDSLRELGSYLDVALGKFSIRDYAEDAEVRTRVTTFLDRLEDFVGRSTEIVQKPTAPPVELQPPAPRLPDLTTVETRIEAGDIWDGLAALRRLVEARLLGYARNRQVELPKRPGAGRMVQILQQKRQIPPGTAERLQFVIDVANRGVHGLQVTTQEALKALAEAQIAFVDLDLMGP